MGRCLIEVKNITSGIYTCGVNGNDESSDYRKQFDVKVYDAPVYVDIQRDSSFIFGDTFHLMCKSLDELPMEYCRFQTPRGQSFAVSQDITVSQNQNFDYFGSGLLNGECGIVVKELQKEDYGNYECTVKVGAQDYTLKMKVDELGKGIFQIFNGKSSFNYPILTGVSLASVFGVSLGVVVVVLSVLLYGGYKFNTRRQLRNTSIDMSRNLTE